MKHILLSFSIFLFGAGAFAQVANGDFEDWNKLALFEHPVMNILTASSNYETYFSNGSLNVTETSHNGGSAMRISNILDGNSVVPGFFITGKMPEQNGEVPFFDGGIPASDPNVDGLSMDMRYSIGFESPGFVMVQFKNEGVPVGPGNMGTGTFHFPLSGDQDWENVHFDFGQSIGVEFDQVVIAIASSDVLSDDINFPVASLIDIDNLAFTNSTDVIPGGDMESWAFVEPIFVPVNCEVQLEPFDRNFLRSGQSNSGTYALGLLTTVDEGFTDIGTAVLGAVSDGQGFVPTIEIDETHSMLDFTYKYGAMDDMAMAVVQFFNSQNGTEVPVFEKVFELEPTDEYLLVNYSFAEELAENMVEADLMSISFSSSMDSESNTPQDGSILYIDDVEVSGTLSSPTLFHAHNTGQSSIQAYPNPTMARVIFEFESPRTGYYRVYNNQGIQVAIEEFSSTDRIIHNLYDLPDGKYVFRFYHNAGIQSVRVMKI